VDLRNSHDLGSRAGCGALLLIASPLIRFVTVWLSLDKVFHESSPSALGAGPSTRFSFDV
jgi:hypothetical protein